MVSLSIHLFFWTKRKKNKQYKKDMERGQSSNLIVVKFDMKDWSGNIIILDTIAQFRFIVKLLSVLIWSKLDWSCQSNHDLVKI